MYVVIFRPRTDDCWLLEKAFHWSRSAHRYKKRKFLDDPVIDKCFESKVIRLIDVPSFKVNIEEWPHGN